MLDERSGLISKLKTEFDTRAAYIRAKVGTLVPSQIRALRLKSEMPRQADLAKAADMKQSRISMMETPGAANMTLDTLSSIAAALKVGLKVQFVPFSEMLTWENGFSQDQFDVVKIDRDVPFLRPAETQAADFVLAASAKANQAAVLHVTQSRDDELGDFTLRYNARQTATEMPAIDGAPLAAQGMAVGL